MIGRWLLSLHTRLLAFSHLPFAALISLDALRNALSTLGYPAVALFVMIESSGIPFPGETMLLLASFYAAVDQRLQIPIVIACAALGAIIGDNVGYLVGRTGGYALVQRFGRYIFLKPEHLQRAERFFARHGDKTVFLGRFVAVLRAWAAFLAGVNRMRWPAFLVYNAAGGIIWAIIFGCLGFLAGRVFHENFAAVEKIARTISWAGAILLAVAIIAAYIFFRLRRQRRKRAEAHEEQGAGNALSEVTPPSVTQQGTANQESRPPGGVEEQSEQSSVETQVADGSHERLPAAETKEQTVALSTSPPQTPANRQQNKPVETQEQTASPPENK